MGEISEKTKNAAMKCINCPLCDRARIKQKGIAYFFVKFLEKGVCPQCKAYAELFGKQAHEKITKKEINARLKELGMKQI